MFVNGNHETVSDGRNTIYLKAKMDIGTEARVSADFLKLGATSIKAYELCLLRHNVVRWQGPGFEDENGKIIPAVAANVDKLDPDEPIVRLAIEKIGELNTKKTAVVTPEEKEANPTSAASVT